jgi:hypothetical protein
MRSLSLSIGLLAIFFMGCSDNSNPVTTPEGDGAFFFISSISVESITPSEFTPGSEVEFTVVGNNRYSGSVNISITGHAGGLDVGSAVSPVTGPIGQQSYRIALPPGRFEIPWVLEISSEIESFALTVHANCDSFLIDGEMHYWATPEGFEVYHEDVPPNTAWVNTGGGMRLIIPKAEEK